MNDNESVKDLSGLSDKEREIAWMDSVRTGVNSLLNAYLPISKIADIGIHYTPEKANADSVVISVIFKFDKTIDATEQAVVDQVEK